MVGKGNDEPKKNPRCCCQERGLGFLSPRVYPDVDVRLYLNLPLAIDTVGLLCCSITAMLMAIVSSAIPSLLTSAAPNSAERPQYSPSNQDSTLQAARPPLVEG